MDKCTETMKAAAEASAHRKFKDGACPNLFNIKGAWKDEELQEINYITEYAEKTLSQ